MDPQTFAQAGEKIDQLVNGGGGGTPMIVWIIAGIVLFWNRAAIKAYFAKTPAAPPATGTVVPAAPVSVKAAPSQPVDLLASIAGLHQQKAEHADAMAKIDALLTSLGQATQTVPASAPAAGAPTATP